MNKLFLGVISLLLCFSAFYTFAGQCLTDNGDGTLTDPNTGLIWQNCAVGEVWDGKSCTGKVKLYSWVNALLVAEENRFQDKNDWILPTKGQYESLLQSYCNRWTSQSFFSSSEVNPSYAWSVSFYNGNLYGDNKFASRVRLVRASQLSDIGEFNASLKDAKKISAAIYDAQKEKNAYEFAKSTNTVAAFTDFINKFPPGLNATMAKAEMDKLLYEPVKRANTVAGYIDYLKKNPYGDHAPDAKEQINNILRPSIIKAEAAFKCEEARQIDKQTEAAGISHLSDFDSCTDKRKFNNVLNLKNPQQQYLEAVKYENGNERSRAKRVYLTIMDNFSTNPVAMKAADRIASLKDVEAVESASSASRAAAERAADASRNAAYSVNRQNSEQCQNNRNACFSGCGIYKDYSQRNSCQSGCPLCAN